VLTPERVSNVWGLRVWRGENGVSGTPVVLPAEIG
jgi:iron complex transport system ATP-binding protein